MPKEKRKPNRNSEFLLDVLPDKKHKGFYYIYDVTLFLPYFKCHERRNYLSRVSHTIKGKQHTIYIIDGYNALSDEVAKKLASEWYLGNTTEHRLD